jgi:alpha-glucosidase
LDGFAGSMTRLRAAYDALNGMWPVAAPPDSLIDAMQSGNRLGHHPERAEEEVAHLHKTLPQAQAAVAQISSSVKPRLENYANRMSQDNARQADIASQMQRRLNALDRAQRLASEAGK